MRVASWNIHGAVGADGRRDIGRVAEVLAGLDADVVGLQEVEARPALSAVDQALALATMLGMTPLRGPLLFEGGLGYGNLLLTRLPVLAVRARRLPGPGHEPRGFVDAVVRHPRHGPWRVLVAHLDLRYRCRQRQFAALAGLFRRHAGGPVVLLADHNEWWAFARGLRRLRRSTGFFAAARAFPARLPIFRLDAVAGLGCRPAGPPRVLRSPAARAASDHLPLVLDLEPVDVPLPPAGWPGEVAAAICADAPRPREGP